MDGGDGSASRKTGKKEGEGVAALQILIKQFPDCFDWNDHRPLKIGIHKDLVARGVDRRLARIGLSRYCRQIGYHQALVEGATRIDLDGQPAGIVTPQEARFAKKHYVAMLEAAVSKQKGRCEQATQGPKTAAEARQRPAVIEPAVAAPAVAPPARLGLADLRTAGRQRRERGPQRRLDN